MIVCSPRNLAGAQKYWERGQLARSDSAGKLPALPVVPHLLRAYEISHRYRMPSIIVEACHET